MAITSIIPIADNMLGAPLRRTPMWSGKKALPSSGT